MQDRAEPPDTFRRHPLIPGCAFDVIEDILEVQVGVLEVQGSRRDSPPSAGHQITGVAVFGDGPSAVPATCASALVPGVSRMIMYVRHVRRTLATSTRRLPSAKASLAGAASTAGPACRIPRTRWSRACEACSFEASQ